jgi:hypothetical protein
MGKPLATGSRQRLASPPARLANMRHLVALVLLLLPGIAEACPACVGQDRNTTILKVVGAFMLVPFGIFFLVLRTIRGALAEPKSPPQPPLDSAD